MTDTCEKHCEATAFKIVIKNLEHEVAKLTHPPQRTWVGLTDEEIENIALEVPINAVLITEAKLKEKNS